MLWSVVHHWPALGSFLFSLSTNLPKYSQGSPQTSSILCDEGLWRYLGHPDIPLSFNWMSKLLVSFLILRNSYKRDHFSTNTMNSWSVNKVSKYYTVFLNNGVRKEKKQKTELDISWPLAETYFCMKKSVCECPLFSALEHKMVILHTHRNQFKNTKQLWSMHSKANWEHFLISIKNCRVFWFSNSQFMIMQGWNRC